MSDLPTSADTYRRLTGIDPVVQGKKIGEEYAVPCINRGSHSHGDKTPSLHINAREKGWTCRVCGVGGGALEMVKFAGHAKTDAEALEWLGVEKEPQSKRERKLIATYRYVTASGSLAYEVLRYDPKDFVQRRRDESGQWVYKLGEIERVPYRLPELRAGIESKRTVIVVEGEKDADTLAGMGFIATTNAGGAAWTWTPGFIAHFTGAKRIVVVADNDDAGRTAARKRAEALREVCGDIRLIEHLPTGAKGDVSDLAVAGWNADRFKTFFERAEILRSGVERLSNVILRQQNAPPEPAPMKTGFRCIDQPVGGFRKGQTTVIGARPGTGKTAFLESIAFFMSESHRVVFASMEMGTDRVVDRTIARMLGMHELEYIAKRRPVKAESLESYDLHFTEYRSMEQIADVADKLRPDVIILDHSRKIDGWYKVEKGSRVDISAAVIMQQIVQLGKQSGAHMVLLSQCTRGADNTRPTLSSLRDSGAVEEDADNVFFLHRPFTFDVKEPDNNAEVICWKARGFKKYIGHLRWLGEYMLFDDPPAEEHWIYSRCCPQGEAEKSLGVA